MDLPAGRPIVAAPRRVAARDRGAVGLTNVFTRTANPERARRAAVSAASELFPGVPIVGYESGDELATAHRHGFVSLGPLRVWINDGATGTDTRAGELSARQRR